ncbi:MAG: CBS domain-containing protein [Agarilytica sp.]
MPVSDIMTTRIIHVSPEDSVGHMQTLLRDNKIHHLLVLQEGKLVGVVSDRDILRIVSPFINTTAETQKDVFTLGRTARQLNLRPPITIQATASIRKAASDFLENGISLLPVINEAGDVVGVLSWKDVLRYLID